MAERKLRSRKPSLPAKALEFAFNATVAEYTAMRATVLSRDEYRNSLLNYVFVFTGVLIAGLPILLERALYVALPIASIVIAGISLLHNHNSRLNTYFILYEHRVLRRRLETAIADAAAIVGRSKATNCCGSRSSIAT